MKMKKFVAMIVVLVMMSTSSIVADAKCSQNEFFTDRRDNIVNCQVWLTQDIEATACKTGEVITLEKGEKMRVFTPVEENIYLCYYGEEIVKVDLEHAMVNISEYIPSIAIDLDMVREKNLFSMAGEKIPGLTDRKFYNSESAESGEAWLCIPAAKMLLTAEEEFEEDGYRIVIYDAYRPYSCTIAFRDAYKSYLKGKTKAFKKEWFGVNTGKNLESDLGESWFLAQNASSHNYGVAVDMSLVSIETGEELVMPSRMHTLDKTSARYYWVDGEAKENAEYMRNVMLGVGFSPLKSEWWHFQDNAIARDRVIDLEF